MSDYGLTSSGINIKRLDVLIDEIHNDLTEAWGINTRQNPQSLLNVFVTDIADQLAELWELGADTYYSQYPTTAEGIYLDGTSQFSGVVREGDLPSYFHVLCTGVEGTVIPKDTILSTNTNPKISLKPTKACTLTRSTFNQASIRVVSLDGNPFTVSLNGTIYSYTPGEGISSATALENFATVITDDDFDVEYASARLIIKAKAEASSNAMLLSENLTTDTIGCVFTFGTEENGDIYLPNGAITEITKTVTGLNSVTNVGSYIAGQLEQTDAEFRMSYIEKILSHSSRMTTSIRSAILSNCQGVSACAVYENIGDTVDEYGRYPHSVEVVVDGGDDTEIATQIYNTKAAGISTFGGTEVTVQSDANEDVVIRFNRPTYLNIWFHVVVSEAQEGSLPANYADLIRSIIIADMADMDCGDDLLPQHRFLPDIYSHVSGVGYVEITMEVAAEKPAEYTQRNIYPNQIT